MRTLAMLALVACGGGQHAPPRHVDRVAEHPSGPAHGSDPAATTTAADCDQLIAHVVAIDAHAQTLGEQDRAAVAAQLHDQLSAGCLGTPRPIVLCGIEAATSEAIAACDQRTPSSSTSNSSVAPGGITPAAPRSP